MKRDFTITKNNRPIPCKPGEFNDCWEINYLESDGYGNWIPSGFSMGNETYEALKRYFSEEGKKSELVEKE